jgi:hypothetical protein
LWRRDALSIIYERKGIIKKEKWSMVRGSTSKGDNVSMKSEDQKGLRKKENWCKIAKYDNARSNLIHSRKKGGRISETYVVRQNLNHKERNPDVNQ